MSSKPKKAPPPLNKTNIVAAFQSTGAVTPTATTPAFGSPHAQPLLPPNNSSFTGSGSFAGTPMSGVSNAAKGQRPQSAMLRSTRSEAESPSAQQLSSDRLSAGSAKRAKLRVRPQSALPSRSPQRQRQPSTTSTTPQAVVEEVIRYGSASAGTLKIRGEEVGFLSDQARPSTAAQGFLCRVPLNDDDFQDDPTSHMDIVGLDSALESDGFVPRHRPVVTRGNRPLSAVPLSRPGTAKSTISSLGPTSVGETSIVSSTHCYKQVPPHSALEESSAAATRWSTSKALENRIDTQKRPSSALSSATRGVNSMAVDVWSEVERREEVTYYANKAKMNGTTPAAAKKAAAARTAAVAAGEHSMFLTALSITDEPFRSSSPQQSPIRSSANRGGQSPSSLLLGSGASGGGAAGIRSIKRSSSATPAWEAAASGEKQDDIRAEQSRQTWLRLWQPNKPVQVTYNAKRNGESVAQRIESLRKNPVARRELAARIAVQEEEQRRIVVEERGDLKKRNMEGVSQYASYFAQARQATAAVRRVQAQEAASHKRQGLQSWRTARAVDTLQLAEFQKRGRAHALEFELLTNSWAAFVVVAVSMCELHDRMVDKMRMLRSPAIKRFTFRGAVFFENINQRQTIRLVKASKVIWRAWLLRRPGIRRRRKRKAIDLCYKFLKAIGESIRIPLAVRKKLHYVRTLQISFRFRKESLVAQQKLCLAQLERNTRQLIVEDEREITRLKSVHLQYEREINAKRGIHRLAKTDMVLEHRQTIDKQIIYLVMRQKTIVRMPLDLKKELVLSFLQKKRADYSYMVYRYGQAMKSYYKDLQKERERQRATKAVNARQRSVSFSKTLRPSRKADTFASDLLKPIKPHFASLFTKEEVHKLVNAAMERLMAEEAGRMKQQREIEEAEKRQKEREDEKQQEEE